MAYTPPAPERTCRAHRSNGDPCRARAIKGGTVCVSHGGAAPQVKERANQRLLALVEPAITALERIIRSGDSDGVKLAACRDVLDRAGFRAAVKLEAEQTMQVTVRYEEQPILHVPTRQNGHSHAVP